MRIAFALAGLPLLAAAPGDLAAIFGARESISQISLSPDGRGVAYVAPYGARGSALYTVKLGEVPKVALISDGSPLQVGGCGWVSDTRLACQLSGAIEYADRIVPASRLLGLDSDGRNQKLLSVRDNVDQARISAFGGDILDWLPGQDGALMVGREFIPAGRTGSRIEQKLDGYGVVRIDTRTGKASSVESPKLDAIEYLSDGRGRVRIMGLRPLAGATGMNGDTVRYRYRTKGSDEWLPFSNYKLGVGDAAGSDLNPFAVDPDLDAVYATRKVDGRLVFVRVTLDAARTETPIFAHPTVDVENVVRLGRARRVIGISYVTDRREMLYFDPALKALAASLSKSLPGQPLVHFAGASQDEQRLLIWAGADIDPGRYYVYERATRKLEEIMLARPQLEAQPLATQRAITFRAADGTNIPAYLILPPGSTGKNIPAIVLPHGGPSARDEWGFDWLAQYFAARGYAVLQPQFRGSSGFGDTWFRNQGFRKWPVAIGDISDAGRWLVAQGIADPSKLAILGWSYGGYAALQSEVSTPGLFKAVVAIAPVADLGLLTEEARGWADFVEARDFIGQGPHVRDGSPARNAGKMKSPVLMFHGDRDANVRIIQSRTMDSAIRRAGGRSELVVYPGLDHYLDDSTARADLLRRSDTFLRSAMGIAG